jgi:hypothetical protein
MSIGWELEAGSYLHLNLDYVVPGNLLQLGGGSYDEDEKAAISKTSYAAKKATPSALVGRLGSTSLGWVARVEETKLGATSWRMEALAAGFIRFHGIRLL